MKSLVIVQKIMKVLKIISLVFIILSAICFIGAVVGAIFFNEVSSLNNNPNSLEGIIANTTFPQAIYSCVIIAITAVGQLILSILSWKFYKHELIIGTPFNTSVVDECKRLGIVYLVVTFVIYIIVKVFIINNGMDSSDVSLGSGVAFGIAYLVVAAILRYGNEVLESKNTKK